MDAALRGLLSDLDFEVHVEGHKSSEGDGRTAADIEREIAEARARREER